MSRPFWLKLALMLTVVCGWSPIAMAQFGGGSNPQGNSPTISPYINLLRGGNTGLNYYGLVRPQQDFAMQNQQLGQGLQNLQMQQMQQGSQMPMNTGSYGYSQLGATGHPVIFNSFGNGQFSGGYFGTGGGGIGGGGGFNGGGGGFGGGNFGGGGGQFGGQSNFGGQSSFGGIGTTGGGFGGVNSGFGGVSGHMSQFGGIGNTYRSGR